MRSLRERRQWRRRRRRTACASCRTLRTQIQPAAPQHAPSSHASTVGRKQTPVQVSPHWPCKSGPLLHNTLPLFVAARSETNGNRSKTSACAGSPTLATQIQFTYPTTRFHFSCQHIRKQRLRWFPCAGQANPAHCSRARFLFLSQHARKQVETDRKQAPARFHPHGPRKASSLLQNTLPLFLARSETCGN